jgi:hypothetical protein
MVMMNRRLSPARKTNIGDILEPAAFPYRFADRKERQEAARHTEKGSHARCFSSGRNIMPMNMKRCQNAINIVSALSYMLQSKA